MKRRGRPRKEGPREPSGRVKRKTRQELMLEQMNGILVQRCRAAGLRPGRDNMLAMANEHCSTHAGRLVARFATQGEREDLWTAIQHILTTSRRYRRAIAAPSGFPAPSAMSMMAGDATVKPLSQIDTLDGGGVLTEILGREEAQDRDARRAVMQYNALESAVKAELGAERASRAGAVIAAIVHDETGVDRDLLLRVLRRISRSIFWR